jgi:serine/threonine protein kinase
MQVLSHIADRLKDLHASGYVHRDIKPGNIMWLPRKKRWTLIDFGCAARNGTLAPTGFSLFYVAPEALRAYMEDEGGVMATEALDAWSVGVLAIELFTGNPVFNHHLPKQDVRFPLNYGLASSLLIQLKSTCVAYTVLWQDRMLEHVDLHDFMLLHMP